MKISRKDIITAFELIENHHSVTIFCGDLKEVPKQRIRITRRFKPKSRDKVTEFIVTVGVPNYKERHFARHRIKVFGRVPKVMTGGNLK